MAGFDSAAIHKEFISGSDWHFIPVVNIGHPAGAPEFGRMPRPALKQVLGWA
jgi:3-hydroxypropanoate dehydrogenase